VSERKREREEEESVGGLKKEKEARG